MIVFVIIFVCFHFDLSLSFSNFIFLCLYIVSINWYVVFIVLISL